MTRTVQRRGAPQKKPAKRKPTRASVAPARMVTLPVAPRRFYTRVAGVFAALLIVGAGITVTLMGLPARWWQKTAVAAAD